MTCASTIRQSRKQPNKCEETKAYHHLYHPPQGDLKKDRMRSHELSRLSERDSQSVFFTNRKKSKKENQIKIIKIGKNVMSITKFS